MSPRSTERTRRRAQEQIRAVVLVLLLLPTTTGAEVRRVTQESREDVLGGRPFGAAGAYEKITGVIEFQVDPARAANARIVDLARATRNTAGLVETAANFMVLKPKQQSKEGGTALLEVSNRGGKAALSYFNRGAWSLDPTLAGDFGDGLLMRHGLTIIWVGWQFDLPPHPGLLRLQAPVATDAERPIEGLVRADWTVDRVVTTLPLGHRNQVPYPVLDPAHPDNVLTVRGGRLAPRRVIPRSEWRFAREVNGAVAEDRGHIHMPTGFQAGNIYELVYRAQDPVIVGLGLAAVRDMISYAKYHPDSPFPAQTAVAVGISQSGRFLRHFLYQRFNTDEAGRRVFDGMLIHSAGAGRGSFNHRFAQPSRDAHRFSAFFYPTDLFPFTSRRQHDPDTGIDDGLFPPPPAAAHLPRIFYTNTGYEYWGRAASLIHTSIDGRADLAPMSNERIYHFAGGQHFVGDFPAAPTTRLPGSPGYRGNPLDFLVSLRALLVRLLEWVTESREPPPSSYPTLASHTLVPIGRLKFPLIPQVTPPRVLHEAYRVDYGPRWVSDGVIAFEPPRLGRPFPSLVSQVDDTGNEIAGVRNVELLAPLATYTPWNLRGGPGPDAEELTDFLGTYVPLPRTDLERRLTGDPRASIEQRYPSKAHYLRAAAGAAHGLVAAGLLLVEDVPHVLTRAERHWEWIERR